MVLEPAHKVGHFNTLPNPPLKGGTIFLPSPLRGEGKGEGV